MCVNGKHKFTISHSQQKEGIDPVLAFMKMVLFLKAPSIDAHLLALAVKLIATITMGELKILST